MIKNGLQQIKNDWSQCEVPIKNYRDSGSKFILGEQTGEVLETLDTDLLKIQSMLNSKYVKAIKDEVEEW